MCDVPVVRVGGAGAVSTRLEKHGMPDRTSTFFLQSRMLTVLTTDGRYTSGLIPAQVDVANVVSLLESELYLCSPTVLSLRLPRPPR